MKEKNFDGLTGLISFIFGLIYIVSIYQTPKALFGDPYDPLYFPYAIAILFIVLGVILMIKGKITPSINAIKSLLNEDEIKKLNRKKVFFTSLIGVSYALVFDFLGYVLSTIVFLMILLCLTNGIKKYKINLFISIVFSVLVYVVFSKLLGISLPPLPFEIGGQRW